MKLCVLFLLALPASATVSGMFPALRKRLEQKKLAVAKHGEQSASMLQEPTEAEAEVGPAPATIPAALDADAEGFPQLPAVSQMLSTASGTLKTVNSQASGLEARVVQAQMASESKMAKQKAAFEEKLKQQEQGNQAVITTNANITEEIKTLKAQNTALRKHSKEVEEVNKLMRSELHTLESRLGSAKDFTTKSLAATDDSKSAMLQILHHRHSFVETGSKKRDDDDEDSDDKTDEDKADSKSDDKDDKDDKDDDEDDDDDDKAASFLSLSSKKRRINSAADEGASTLEAAINDLEGVPDVAAGPAMPTAPEESPIDLLTTLSKEVAQLAQQEKESEKNLRNLFIRDFRAGAKRHQALLAQQKTLKASRASLQAIQKKLKAAEAHLESTKAQLEGRLHGLGQYLQKLAHFAMAPQREVPHLLEVLPKAVTIKTEVKKEL